jgi:DNA polymerase-3 subunit delta'
LHAPEGSGQWPLALGFAALLNCETPVRDDQLEAPSPCGQCRACRMISGLNYEGLHLILPIGTHKKDSEAIELTNELLEIKKNEPLARIAQSSAVNIPISLAREVGVKLSRIGDKGARRVVLFYRIDRMRLASADALLKMIEEPPLDTVIILTADRPERLPRTIQSRAQKIKLGRWPEPAIESYLEQKYELSQERARLLARLAEGIPGVAVELAGESDEEEMAVRTLGAELLNLVVSSKSAQAVALITDQFKARDTDEAESLLRLWQSLLRDSHYMAVTGSNENLTNIDLVPQLERTSRYLKDARTVSRLVGEIKNTLADFGRNVHIPTALAALSFRMAETITTSPSKLT